MPVTPALHRLRQVDSGLKARLGCIVRPYLKKILKRELSYLPDEPFREETGERLHEHFSITIVILGGHSWVPDS
jgi:hypothetical protein